MARICGVKCLQSRIKCADNGYKQYNNRNIFFFFMLQFVQFARSYNITPSVLISANHSTTASGNLAPVHNGITTWIEVKHNALFKQLIMK